MKKWRKEGELIDSSLEPTLQAFFDIGVELDPETDLGQFETIRKGIKFCIENDLEPFEALEELRECPEPFINVQA